MQLITPELIDIISLPSLAFNDRKQLPNVSAVYFVLEEGVVIYVGATENLLKRWKANNLKQLGARPGQLRIAWLECSAASIVTASKLPSANTSCMAWAFSSPVLTTLMSMFTNIQIVFRTSRPVYDDVELTPDRPPKFISLPVASNEFHSPILRLLRQSLTYCYNRFSRVTSAFSTFQYVSIIT
jgi:hypothetical protein